MKVFFIFLNSILSQTRLFFLNRKEYHSPTIIFFDFSITYCFHCFSYHIMFPLTLSFVVTAFTTVWPFQTTLKCITWAEGRLEQTSLPLWARGKVCVHSIISRLTLWDYAEYATVVDKKLFLWRLIKHVYIFYFLGLTKISRLCDVKRSCLLSLFVSRFVF